ncbi:hypothetical protein BO99DRAFT_378603 [Aspergillus violaceofuscus CBS 115571]|uniref:Zn(2)-C6 fungal-type domain-containing protein n=1 Tax=Aspergillus violaceofuscus (strain CBS 115571) TaxID=1450538 RepID=A0A2V5HF63_ASPV1|nr:hypothetical protein BO99DRAFT_378603 [Aspergillus violaceofuscus CBS 115571]
MPARRQPCAHCRRHHLRCDDSRPKCERCRNAGRECIRSSPQLQFLNTTSAEYAQDLSDVSNALNITSKHAFEYVDETPALAAFYAAETTIGVEQTDAFPFHPTRQVKHGGIRSSERTWDESRLSAITTPLSADLPSPQSQTQAAQAQLSLEEACLIRYFVESLGLWFDLCDPERHFAVVVPQRARICAPLLDAILSASARHFSTLPQQRQLAITQNYGLKEGLAIGEESMLAYHSRSIAGLRAASQEPNAIMDENLLAAVVILRFYEELDSPFTDPPSDTAVRGLQVFLEAQASSAIQTCHGLRSSAFWVGFRQEFHMAISQRRSFRIPLATVAHYLPTRASPDHVWTNRLLIIGAHVIQYCFPPVHSPEQSPGQKSTAYEHLLNLRQSWAARAPSSFIPIYTTSALPSERLFFPQQWFLNDTHIVATQSLGLIDLLLATHDPHVDRLRPRMSHRRALAVLDEEIRTTVREICGVAVANRQSPTAALTASLAVVLGAEAFREASQAEKDVLLAVVRGIKAESYYFPGEGMEGVILGVWGEGKCRS